MFDWFKQKTQSKAPAHKFYIQCQPRIIETNSNIIVTCYTSRTRQGIVPCRFCWYRTKNDVTSVIPHVKGSTYMCQPSDLGAIIRVEVTSLDEEASGSATLQFGPVKIDLMTRKNVEGVLSAGFGNFTVFLSDGEREREAVMKISDGAIRLTDVLTQSSYKFEYTIAQPRIDINLRDHTKLTIHFTQRYEQQLLKFLKPLLPSSQPSTPPTLQLRFPNRSLKDVFLYSHKAFVSKKQAKTAHLLNKIQNTDQTKQETFDFSMEIASLKTDMVRLLEINRQQVRDKEFYGAEIGRLEEEMETIIMTYTKIIEDRCKNQQDFDKSYAVLTDKREELVMKKQAQLEIDNQEMSKKIQVLMQENTQLKNRLGGMTKTPAIGNFTKKAAPYEDIDCKMEELSIMNSRLVEENRKLKIHHHNTSQDMGNILAEVNQSAVQGDPNQQRITQLQKQKQQLHRKLTNALLKNQQLSRSQLQAHSVKLQPHRRNPTPNPSLVMDSDSRKIISQLSELRRDNDLLVRQNRQLRNASRMSNTDMSKISGPPSVSPVKEQHSVGGEPRGQNVNELKREIMELTTVNAMLERKCDGLVVENSELRRKVGFLEGKVEELEVKAHSQGEINDNPLLLEKEKIIKSLEAENLHLREQLLNISRLDTAKYKKKIEELLEQNKLLRKGTDVMNKSRDLSMQMDSYYEQENAAMKKQVEMLVEENEKLVRMQERGLKDGREANKLRQEVVSLRKQIEEIKRTGVSIVTPKDPMPSLIQPSQL